MGVCVCYRLYFECVHIETTDNIDFYSENVIYINYKVYGKNSYLLSSILEKIDSFHLERVGT